MKFMTIAALLITTPAFAAIFDSIESVDVIQKEIQAKNTTQEDRKPAADSPASTEEAPGQAETNEASSAQK